MHWSAWDYFCLYSCSFWLTFWIVIENQLGQARLCHGDKQLQNLYGFRHKDWLLPHVIQLLWVTRGVWPILDAQETCLMWQPPSQTLLVAGPGTREVIPHFWKIPHHYWKLCSLSIPLTIHWPELVIWPHPITKGSGGTADMIPGGKRISHIWKAALMTTTLSQHPSSFLSPYFIN